MLKKNFPLLAGLAFIIVSVAAIEYLALKKTGGHFCYPLDDTFIHMALSKNIAEHGNWGINASGFTSTSSSPLFTILLALLLKIFSDNLFLPFVLSFVGTLLVLVAMQQELRRHSTLTSSNQALCILIALLLGTIPAMTLLGMEHTLQTAFVLFFVHNVASVLTSNKKEYVWRTAAWAALMTITRYETSFLVLGSFLLLLTQKKLKDGIIISFAGVLPIVLFGLYSVSKGGYFIPNSVMIKSNQTFVYLLNGGANIIEKTGVFGGLFITGLVLAYQRFIAKKYDRDFWILCLFLFAVIMHAVSVSLSWFYRYEAYLVVLGTLHIGKLLLAWGQENGWQGLRRNAAVAVVAVVLLYSLPVRGLNALRNSVRGIENIYDQQYQMGMFMKQFYPGATVACNDIGAVSYYGQLKTIDLWGLGNNEAMRARKQKAWNSAFLQQLVADNNTRLAVIYDSWFDKDLPSKWTKVATWTAPFQFTVGDATVTFYSINAADANTLKNNLKTFESQLPGSVKAEYFQ